MCILEGFYFPTDKENKQLNSHVSYTSAELEGTIRFVLSNSLHLTVGATGFPFVLC